MFYFFFLAKGLCHLRRAMAIHQRIRFRRIVVRRIVVVFVDVPSDLSQIRNCPCIRSSFLKTRSRACSQEEGIAQNFEDRVEIR